MKGLLEQYLQTLHSVFQRGDAREESFYPVLSDLFSAFAENLGVSISITTLPRRTEAGNPDFRIWRENEEIIGYIEAKKPGENLDKQENSEQLKRYREVFPNLILTDFYEFRLYRNGTLFKKTFIARSYVNTQLGTIPPVENVEEFRELLEIFFGFSFPAIQNAERLAEELAKRTRFLKSVILDEDWESPGSKIEDFYKIFRDTLLKGLTKKRFADLYAQTVTYGLFAARTRSSKTLTRQNAYEFIPGNIPVLRNIFEYISLESSSSPQMKSFIEDIVNVLNATEINKILQAGSDPILHFYETFLKEYDPEIREKRGVYYTPEEVVKYMVNAVDFLLEERFKEKDGLASENLKLLDPAAGTLTFPAEALALVLKKYTKKYGMGNLENWMYSHPLKNFYAFELMMAPYVVAHLKISYLLQDAGIELNAEHRFPLYLTNALDPREPNKIPLFTTLTRETEEANRIKKQEKLLVILGNPPYSGHSANKNTWIDTLMKENNFDNVPVQSYFIADGKRLQEKNPKWIQDDYVKFLRFAQWKIAQAGKGIVTMITNHSYLDNPTFRGMRQSLMKTFDEIYILNLHGNTRKQEKNPSGKKDENVFDIQQGTAIGIFIKHTEKSQECKVFYKELWGTRQEKSEALLQEPFPPENYTQISPQKPWYFFVPFEYNSVYDSWKAVNEIFPKYSVGIVTARDKLAIGFSKEELKRNLQTFQNPELPDENIRETFQLKDKKNWKLSEARENFRKVREELKKKGEDFESLIRPILYRPFDIRYIWYYNSKILVERLRWNIMKNMLAGENLGLIAPRQTRAGGGFRHTFVTNFITNLNVTGSAGSFGSGYLFPLYLYPDVSKEDLFSEMNSERQVNISPEIIRKLEGNYKQEIKPEDLLYYVYAITYSKIYRTKFREVLKIDFPKIPFTSKYELFERMVKLGKELTNVHLLRSKKLENFISKFEGEGKNLKVEKINYVAKKQKVFINETKYFTGVAPEVWNYQIGNYQVPKKWLEERKGRHLSHEDTKHYLKLLTALHNTIQLQKKIDKVYPNIEKTAMEF